MGPDRYSKTAVEQALSFQYVMESISGPAREYAIEANYKFFANRFNLAARREGQGKQQRFLEGKEADALVLEAYFFDSECLNTNNEQYRAYAEELRSVAAEDAIRRQRAFVVGSAAVSEFVLDEGLRSLREVSAHEEVDDKSSPYLNLMDESNRTKPLRLIVGDNDPIARHLEIDLPGGIDDGPRFDYEPSGYNDPPISKRITDKTPFPDLSLHSSGGRIDLARLMGGEKPKRDDLSPLDKDPRSETLRKLANSLKGSPWDTRNYLAGTENPGSEKNLRPRKPEDPTDPSK